MDFLCSLTCLIFIIFLLQILFFGYNNMSTVIESLFFCFSLSRVIFWVIHNFLVWEIHFLVPDHWIEVCHVLFRLRLQVSNFEIPFSGFKSLFKCFSGWTKNFQVSGFHFRVSNSCSCVFPVEQRIFRFQITIMGFLGSTKNFPILRFHSPVSGWGLARGDWIIIQHPAL